MAAVNTGYDHKEKEHLRRTNEMRMTIHEYIMTVLIYLFKWFSTLNNLWFKAYSDYLAKFN